MSLFSSKGKGDRGLRKSGIITSLNTKLFVNFDVLPSLIHFNNLSLKLTSNNTVMYSHILLINLMQTH